MNPWQRLVRFGFRLLYNELAFTYDTVSKIVSMGAWRCWQRSALKFLPAVPDARVLEIAHGTGDLQLDLYAAGYRPVGYDLSPHMGRIAARKLMRHGIMPRLIRGHAEHLPFQAACFDAIVCTFPTNFIFEPRTLAECWRILEADGRLIVVLSGVFTQGGITTRLLELAYRVTGQRETRSAEEELDTDIYTRIVARFEAAGFAARFSFEDCPRSKAVVIIAQKPAAPL